MKIIALSDIHGDFETFDKALPAIMKSDAEVITITGDLTGSLFPEDERKIFAEAQDLVRYNADVVVRAAKKNYNEEMRSLDDVAAFLASGRDPKVPEPLKQTAQSYKQMADHAEKVATLQYRGFKQRFASLGKQVVLVPGNWDTKSLENVLDKESIHKNTREICGVKFAGFGGSNMAPNEIPEDKIYGLNEDEAFTTLSGYEDAEVVLMHEPPRFFEGEKLRHDGSYAFLAYMLRNQPSLMLTGHTHHLYAGKDKKTGTVILNPGNLGRYQNMDFGTFVELELDDDLFVKLKGLYKVRGDSAVFEEFK